MTRRQIVLPSPPPDRREPLLQDARKMERLDQHHRGSPCRGGDVRRRDRLAEVAGGSTAECAAVACCCPCGLVELLVLAAYKLPAGLCKKALGKRRRRRMARDGLGPPPRRCGCDEKELHLRPITDPAAVADVLASDNSEVIELEKEMWDRFYSTGFWRSASQRSDVIAQ